MARSSDSPKLLEWQRRMSRFEKLQRPVTRFCRDEGVSVPSFYQWRKKLQQRQQARSAAGDVGASFAAVRPNLPMSTQCWTPILGWCYYPV